MVFVGVPHEANRPVKPIRQSIEQNVTDDKRADIVELIFIPCRIWPMAHGWPINKKRESRTFARSAI